MDTTKFRTFSAGLAVFLTFCHAASAQWVAFNDHAPGNRTHANASRFHGFANGSPSSGLLKNISSGANTSVTLAITRSASGVTAEDAAANPSPDTPLAVQFAGFVDFAGSPGNSIALSGSGVLTYTFTGLNPARRYNFKGSAVRGDANHTNRWTLSELSGADTFTHAHSSSRVLTRTQVPALGAAQAALNTGVNHTDATGDYVGWDTIAPGPDGSFSVTCSQYSGTVPGGSANGSKGYGLTGVRLEEVASESAAPQVLIQPYDVYARTGSVAALSVFATAAAGAASLSFQWWQDALPLTTQTNATLRIPNVQLAHAGSYFVVITNGFGSVTSAVARLTPLVDAGGITNRPWGADLEVSWIDRSPMYQRYIVDYPNGKPVLRAGTENTRRWPTNGELVTFTAHLANKGLVASGPFSIHWRMDGQLVASASHPGLEPGTTDTAVYRWVWAHQMRGERVLDRHQLTCSLDEENVLSEPCKQNNRLDEMTAAWSLQFIITPEMYRAYSQPAAAFMPFSAEWWIQRQIVAMNTNFDRAIYPLTPEGAGVAVRVGQIAVASNNNASSTAFDGGWFIDADYRRGASAGYEASTDIDWNLLHELCHQVGLIDNYNYNIESDFVKVIGFDEMPANFSFSWPRDDLMGGGDIAPYTNPHYFSSWTARGAMETSGFRRGYYGEYQFDIPRQNFLLVRDSQGQIAPGVSVQLFQDGSGGIMDNTPELTGTTDAAGLFWLTNRSVGGAITTRTDHVQRDNPFGLVDVVGTRNTFLGRLVKGDHEEFFWLNMSAFNLAYWAGNTETNVFVVNSHVPPSGAPAPPSGLTGHVQGTRVTLCWTGVSGAQSYRVYVARRPEHRYELIASNITDTCWTTTSHSQTRIYVVTAVNAAGIEGGFSLGYWTPLLRNPAAVVTAADGQRIVLDPQNGHAFLEQRYDGRFIQNIGSVHYHLEYTKFFCLDHKQRLILSHPSDGYSSRHSVRMTTRSIEPVLEFGQRGSGPGEFETPAGVAVMGYAAAHTNVLDNDAHTLLLLHGESNVTSANGESGVASGLTYPSGRFGSGISIRSGASLTFPTAGNMLREQGAIEFWFQPDWNGNDTIPRYFFAVGQPFNDGFQIMKDGGNNLRLMMWRGSQETGVGYGISSWRAGEWHHIAVAWSTNQITLFVDGNQRNSRSPSLLPNSLASTLFIGSASDRSQIAAGTFDEFRISDIPRIGNSDTVDYTIFVADSGNHRIQTFREDGSFISAFGTLGTKQGQFNSPQGLALDTARRLLVADRLNNRVQVFDARGTNLVPLKTLTGLNQPVGVTTWRDTHWIVADTGNSRVNIYDTNGTLLATHSAPNDGSTGNFLSPQGVSTDRNGTILVADTGNRRIVSLAGLLPSDAPPRFLTPEIRLLLDGRIAFRISGPPGRKLQLLRSDDLQLWHSTATLSLNDDFAEFTDTSPTPATFYRAVLLP